MQPRPRALPKFPGIPATAEGSEAVVGVETHVSQGACAYPITSSTHTGPSRLQGLAGTAASHQS